MAKVDLNKPLQVEAIYIKGRPDPIKSSVVFILDNFIIIAKDLNDTAPTWYNVNLIERLVGVKAETTRMHIG